MTNNPLIIELSKLNTTEDAISGVVPVAILAIEDDRQVHLNDPLKFDLQTQKVSSELIVQGTLEVSCDVECSRCAEIYSTTVTVSSFLRAYEIPDGTDTVDLTADVREDILLALPSFPLCSDGCKGLCPQCGKNWNEGPCACKPSKNDGGPWAALNGLGLPEDK
jgi:uncharacterized metal-binding protein YceD (DUF177 family)